MVGFENERPEPAIGNGLSWAILLSVVGGLGIWYNSQGSTTCEDLKHEVIPISEENANVFQPKMIDLVEIKTLSSKDGELECSGLAILSDSTKQNVAFRKVKEYDKWWVKYEGSGLPF